MAYKRKRNLAYLTMFSGINRASKKLIEKARRQKVKSLKYVFLFILPVL
jgi:hypothetical protein